ncbi:MAG: hypothetical protein ABGX16_16220 [Pirellulales bacterium]
MRRRDHTSISISLFAFQDIITSVVGIFILITLLLVLELVRSHASTLPAQQAAAELPDSDEREKLEASKKRVELAIVELRSDSANYGKGRDSESRKGRFRSQIAARSTDIDRLDRANRTLDLEIRSLETKAREARRRLEHTPLNTELNDLRDRLASLQTTIREVRQADPVIVTGAKLPGKEVIVVVISKTKAKATSLSDASLLGEEQVLGRNPAEALAAFCARRAIKASQPLHIHLLIRPSAAGYGNQAIEDIHGKYSLGFDLIREEQTVRFTR